MEVLSPAWWLTARKSGIFRNNAETSAEPVDYLPQIIENTRQKFAKPREEIEKNDRRANHTTNQFTE